MNIGIICSNNFNIDEKTKKGTEIFAHLFIHNLTKYADKNTKVTVFASGDSSLPAEIESIDSQPSSADPEIIKHDKHIIFELALISKAFTQQDKFDLYHVHIGDGDIVIPFAPFVKKPILITLHHIYDADFTRKYFSLFQEYQNIFFVSISNAQRKILPNLRYAANIYHGLDIENFPYDPNGGESMMWAGRAIPEKGMEEVINIAADLKKKTKLFAVTKKESKDWFDHLMQAKVSSADIQPWITMNLNRERLSLVPEYATSKLFLYPIQLEEPFGLVLVEAMACGTPIIAFARGSIPEIIRDGETGFIINSSDEDNRGNWIIKKTGTEGLKEAVERIYAMTDNEYKRMRQACRKRVEEYFAVERMVHEYQDVYQTILNRTLK